MTNATASSPSSAPSVAITGCSVGAGRAAALLLDRKGWRVFAAVRKPADAEALEAASTGSLRAFLCDVRDRDQVFAFAKDVESELGAGGLTGLVCNAGVGASGPIEFLDHEEMVVPIEVNFYGSIYCAQAFLPLLREAKGRILNVTSGSTLFTMPLMSTYPASKLAIEQLSRQLQAEVAAFGVHVAVIDPGHIKTRMTLTAGEASAAARTKLPPEANALYGRLLDRMDAVSQEMQGSGKEPEEVAEIYFQALTDASPKAFYTVGNDARGLRWASKFLPDFVKTAIANRIMTG